MKIKRFSYYIKNILVILGISKWNIHDLLSGEKYPLQKGEWGIIYPISRSSIRTFFLFRKSSYSPSTQYIFKKWHKGKLVKLHFMNDEEYRSLPNKLRKSQDLNIRI